MSHKAVEYKVENSIMVQIFFKKWTQVWLNMQIIKSMIWYLSLKLIIMIQREKMVGFVKNYYYYYKDVADAFVSSLCKAENGGLFSLWTCKQRISLMRRVLSKMWMITWFVVAEEALGKTEKPQCSSVWICPSHFNMNLLRDWLLLHTHTHKSFVGLFDCSRKKIDMISFKMELNQKWMMFSLWIQRDDIPLTNAEL